MKMIKGLGFLATGALILNLNLADVSKVKAEENYSNHVINTNLLLAWKYHNITYSSDSKTCFTWEYSEIEKHWHVLNVENPKVVSEYIESDDEDGHHLILGCYGATTKISWR